MCFGKDRIGTKYLQFSPCSFAVVYDYILKNKGVVGLSILLGMNGIRHKDEIRFNTDLSSCMTKPENLYVLKLDL